MRSSWAIGSTATINLFVGQNGCWFNVTIDGWEGDVTGPDFPNTRPAPENFTKKNINSLNSTLMTQTVQDSADIDPFRSHASSV